MDLAMRVLDNPTPRPERLFTEDGDWTNELHEWTSANGVSLDWLITGEMEVLLRYTAQHLLDCARA